MHMASDRRQFNQALRRWDALHEKGAYSLPVDEGGVAILCSGYGLGEPDQKAREVQAFEAEAKRIADLVYSRGIDVAEFYDFDEHDMIQVLTDRTFSSVITIGNGNLSETYGYGGDGIDWRFVSLTSDHLKLGRFTMRHCGQAIRNLSAPLGTFAMANHSDVFAAYATYLPTVMEDEDEYRIQRLHSHRRLSYHAIKNMFQQIIPDKDEPDDVIPEIDHLT